MSSKVKRILLAVVVSLLVAVAVAVPAALQLDDPVLPGEAPPATDGP